MLASKTFHAIVLEVSEKNGLSKDWLYQADNDPRSYRAPSLKWSERDGNDNVKGFRRFDLDMQFEHAQMLHVIYPWPQISVLALSIKKSGNASGNWYANAQIQSLAEIVTFPDALEVLHLQMDFCLLLQTAQFCGEISTSLSHLSTLSLTMAAQDLRAMLGVALHLPQLRALFLTFTAFGLGDYTLSGWDLPSLCIVSFHLPIGSRGIQPVKVVPTFITKFLRRYGAQIEGLRILPGPWTYSNKQLIIPLHDAEEASLWGSMTALKTLSTDFSHFPLTTVPSSTLNLFARIQHLWQRGKSAPADYMEGIEALVRVCPNLRTLRFDREGERILGPYWSPLHSQNSRKFRKLCEQRQIKLLGYPEESIMETMGPDFLKKFRAIKDLTGETRYIANYSLDA
jgi:hypothetical protein